MLECERCTELAEGFLMSDPATTEQAVAALRTRLQARLGRAEPRPDAGSRAWPRLATAAAIVGLAAGGLWTLEHRQVPAAAHPETTQPAAPATKVASAPAAAPPAALEKPAGISESLKIADYAAVTAARPARTAGTRRHPTTSRPPGKQVARVAAPSPTTSRTPCAHRCPGCQRHG